MLIKNLDILIEFFIWVLVFAITFSNATVETCLGFVVFFTLIKRIKLKDPRPPKTAINTFLYIFAAIIFISFLRSAFSSPYFKDSFKGVLRIIKYGLLYFSVVDFLKGDRKRIIRLFWVFIGVSAFTFLNGIFQVFSGFDILRHRQINYVDFLHRVSSSFIHPNDFGGYIISVLPLTFVFFIRGLSRIKRVVLIVTCLLGFYCLLATSSRSAWLGFLIGTFIYFLFYNKRIAMLLPIVVIVFIFIYPHGFGRFMAMFANEQNTVWERMQLWKGTWAMVKEHPVLGLGINTFSNYFPKFKPVDYPDLRYTHNSYLQMWSEIGIVGLLAFLSIVFIFFKKTLHNLKKKVNSGFEGLILLGSFAGYIAFLFQSGLDTNLFSLVLVTQFWLINAYLMSLNSILEK